MVLKWLAPLWIIDGLTLWASQIHPDGTHSPFELPGFLLSLLVYPWIAGHFVAMRGGSHFARIAAGVSMAGATLASLGLICPDFGAYRYIFLSTLVATLVQGPLGWAGGMVAALIARRRRREFPATGIRALDGTGAGFVLMGLWAAIVGFKWLGAIPFIFGLAVLACGAGMIIKAARPGMDQMPRRAWMPIVLGSAAVLAVPVLLIALDYGVVEIGAKSQHNFLCEKVTVIDWHVEPRGGVAEKDVIKVRVRARSDSSVRLSFVHLYDATSNYVAIDDSDSYPMIAISAGSEAVLKAPLGKGPWAKGPAVLTQWALCTSPGIGTESCAWWGYGDTSVHKVAQAYCPTPPPTP